MSIRAFAKSNTDPWKACHWGVASHPHYHDCANCKHARPDGCEYGQGYLARKQAEEIRARLKEFEESMQPYPSLDPKRLP